MILQGSKDTKKSSGFYSGKNLTPSKKTVFYDRTKPDDSSLTEHLKNCKRKSKNKLI